MTFCTQHMRQSAYRNNKISSSVSFQSIISTITLLIVVSVSLLLLLSFIIRIKA